MGLDPDEDVGTVILDPQYLTGVPWVLTSPWQRIANRADYDGNRVGFGAVSQINITTLLGGLYILTFDMGNANFSGGRGVKVRLNGISDGTVYNTNGTHETEIFTPYDNSILQLTVIPKVAGDTCWIDNWLIRPASNYVRDVLNIVWPGPQKYEFINVDGTRMNQTMASRNGKTNCLIAFDI